LLKYIKIENILNYNTISQCYCFNVIFIKQKAVLLSIRDYFQKMLWAFEAFWDELFCEAFDI